MKKKFTFMMAAVMLLVFFAVPRGMWGETTYEQLTSIANIDENAQYVLGIDGTGFHYSGTSSWGQTALPSAQTPIYYTLTKASNGNSFTAQATIGNTTYYLQVPTSNTFSMATSAGTNTDLIIGTTQVSGTNYAVANNTTTARHLRINGTSGLRSYAGTTGTMAFFYKVVTSGPSMSVSPASIDFGNENTINPSEPYTRTFNVTFANLTESLSVNVGSGLTGVSVSPTSIAAKATSPQTVTVSYNPTAVGNLSGNITVSNTDDNLSENVAVTGSAYDPANVDTYELYTGALVEGDYIICANAEVAMKNVISGSRFENEAVTVTDNKITNPGASIIWHVAPEGDYFTMYNAAVGKYAAGTTSNNQGTLIDDITDYAKWDITYQYSNYTVICYGRNSSSNKYLRRNGDYGWATYANSTGQVPTFYKKVITNQVAAPTFSVASGTYYETKTVELSCETSGATIYYTTDGTTPSATNGTEYIAAISVSTTTTIKAIAIKNGMTDSDVATATYTIEQLYNTIPALFAAAIATEQDVRVTFDNWVVSGVSTNGRNVYVTDNNGNGFIIYFTSDMSGTFAAGNILSGTAVACKLKLYNGAAELVNLTATDLTITTGGTVSISNIPMSDLSGVNTGALVSYNNLTCSVSDNKYYLTDGTTTLQAYNTLYAFNEFEDGKTYNVTGVYVQYNSIKEIAPRSADDVVLKANMSSTDLSGLTAFTYILGSGPSDVQTITIIGSDFSGDLTVNAPANYQVSSDNSTWGATATYTPSLGTVDGTLYIRLAANLAAGEYNGSMTFNANNLTTISANLEGTVSANPTYIISLNQTTGGTISADLSVAEEGQTVNLSYTYLDDCYTFNGWTVLDENADEVPVTNNQFTMPASDVEVEGIFTQKTFTVQYSVNGTVVNTLTESVNCGNDAALPTSGFTVPTGYTFAGWSTAANNTAVVSSYTPDDNITLYAVLFQSGSSLDYVKVTEDLTDWSGEYLIVYEDGNVAFDGSLITLDATSNTIGVTINSDVIDSNATNDASTFTITNKGNNNYSLKSKSGKYIGHTGSSNALKTSDTDDYDNTISFSNNVVTITCNSYKLKYNKTSGQTRFRYFGSGQEDIQLYKKQTPTAYTLVEDITTDASLPSIEPTYLITVKDGGVLTLTGNNNGDETNLIIEDGGQLITTSTGVKATFKKTTTASSEAKDATNYWYAISSPVDEIAISSFAAGTHNVYSYVEKSHYWNEYRGEANATLGTVPFTNLENGRGYLYRSTASGIDFKGDVNIDDATYTLTYTPAAGNLAGFHLIGNPFSYNIYKGVDIPNTYLEDNFYTLTPEGGWELGYDSGATEPTAIKPNTGILVQAKSIADDQTLTIAKTRNGGVSKYDNDQISFKVENSDYYDVACVQFKDGRGLNKIEHRNAEIPMLYIMNNGENFGAANMPDNTDVINLGFEAKTMGQYTISLKAEGQYSYMHLVDKLTGNDIDMLVEDSYTFVGTPNDRNDRFVLRLNYNAAGIDTESDIFAYQSGNDIMVSGEGELQVFDITGRKVMTTDINGVETINGMNRGVYIFRLNEKTQKIVVR